ncbi:MAG TPA: hypothetical protein VGC62_22300 [Pseudomonas sp.]
MSLQRSASSLTSRIYTPSTATLNYLPRDAGRRRSFNSTFAQTAVAG